MSFPNMLQQSLRRVFHHVQHALEAFRAAIVRVGNFALGMMPPEQAGVLDIVAGHRLRCKATFLNFDISL